MKMNDKELREKTKHRTFTSMAQRRRWLALNEQIQENRKEEKMEIKVNDKVKWSHSFQALNQQCFGHVVNAHVKVMGNPCFLIQSSIDNRQVMVSKDKVSKA
jgi:hypothetical protein